MNIGVDGGALSVPDERLKLGVYQVNFNLLRCLSDLDKKNNYTVYSFDPIDPGIMKQFGSTITNKVLRPKKGWFSVRLPLELSLSPVDLFLGLSQSVPRTNVPGIGFIYDLGFIHNPGSYPGSLKKLSSQTDDLVKRSRSIITISHAVKKDIRSHYGIDASRITVAYPGISRQFNQSLKAHAGDNPYFLFVGALKPGKNVPALIRAFASFLKEEKNVFDLYLLGGEYWKDPEIDGEIARLDLSPRVRKLGYVAEDKLSSYYSGATAFVSPSLYEGFCLPAVEAMACGCPVVGSTAGAMKEIVGDAGILVAPQDERAIASAMKTMANNGKVRGGYTQKGILQAKKYSWKSFASTVLSVINESDK